MNPTTGSGAGWGCSCPHLPPPRDDASDQEFRDGVGPSPKGAGGGRSGSAHLNPPLEGSLHAKKTA